MGVVIAIVALAGISIAMSTRGQREESRLRIRAWSRKWLFWPVLVGWSYLGIALALHWLQAR
jgi:hypothetical protein